MSSLSIVRYPEPGFDLDTLKTLFREYNEFLGISLDFQGFETELASLPGKYAPNLGGQLYLAQVDQKPAGCAAFYRLSPAVCEIKRVFVHPQFQGLKIGRHLMVQAIEDAREAGYSSVVLDSLKRLKAARKLYENLGFSETTPYNANPHPDVYYMTLAL